MHCPEGALRTKSSLPAFAVTRAGTTLSWLGEASGGALCHQVWWLANPRGCSRSNQSDLFYDADGHHHVRMHACQRLRRVSLYRWLDQASDTTLDLLPNIPSDTKLLLTKNVSETILFDKLRISYAIPWKGPSFPEILKVRNPSKITKKNSQGILFVIISCQRVSKRRSPMKLIPMALLDPKSLQTEISSGCR